MTQKLYSSDLEVQDVNMFWEFAKCWILTFIISSLYPNDMVRWYSSWPPYYKTHKKWTRGKIKGVVTDHWSVWSNSRKVKFYQKVNKYFTIFIWIDNGVHFWGSSLSKKFQNQRFNKENLNSIQDYMHNGRRGSIYSHYIRNVIEVSRP